MHKILSLAAVTFLIITSGLSAQDIDGTYKYRKGSGKFKVDGREYKLSSSELKNFAVIKDAKSKISNNKLKLNHKGVKDAFNKVPGRVTVSGPSSITLKKSSGSSKYKGRAVVWVKVKAVGYESNIKVVLNAEVSGKNLTLKAPVSGETDYLWGLIDSPVKGEIKLEARR